MLTLNDGRSELWQWDTGRTLAVDADCSQVHFSNKVFGRSIDVDVVDGVAIIPDILLQTDKDLNVWAFVGTAENGYTKISKTFTVNRRNKPVDYVFTQTDQMTLQTIQRQIGDLADLTTEAKDTLVAAINEAARTGGGAGSIDLRVAGGYVQYSRDGGMTWTNLIAMEDLKGDPGAPGADGKSAYQYAVEGGYTGTEEEFAEKLAANLSGSGMSQALRVAIYNLLMDAAYQSSGHESDKAALEELLTGSSGGGESGGEVIYYTIEKTLTNVSISNGAASVAAGSAYSATLTADEGYTIDSVTVTMGGEAVTVTDGVIEIASVTGNIVITATATAEGTGGYEWTSGTAYDFSDKIIENATLDSSTGVEVASDGNSCTDYINCFDVDYLALSTNGGIYWFYDVSKNFISKANTPSKTNHCAVPDGAVFFRTNSTNITVTPVSKSADNYTAGEQAVTWSKGAYDSTGAIVSSSKYISTVFPIAGASTLTLGDSVQATQIVLFDEYQNYVRLYTSQNTPLDLTSINFVPYSFAAVGGWSAATITLT